MSRRSPLGGGRRPVIGITGRRMPIDSPFPLLGSISIQETYADAVDRAGGLPAVLAPRLLGADDADDYIASLDGLLLTGGPDVDPGRYGQDAHARTYGVSRLQDEFEVALLDAADRRDKPVLCICRGLQLLNVAHGGTLHQHLPEVEGTFEHGIPAGGGGTRNVIDVDPDSRLAAALGTTTPEGECHHHQGVDRVGAGLRIVARAADGVVEGLEPATSQRWLVAVQWHPEDTAHHDSAQQRLVDELVIQARRRGRSAAPRGAPE